MYKIEKSNNFKNYIIEATCKLHNYEFDESYQIILKALNENPDAPEPHNLLGIWYELKKNNNLARKHYRAAYALDPTYQPASGNLERVCSSYVAHKMPVDYGEEKIEL